MNLNRHQQSLPLKHLINQDNTKDPATIRNFKDYEATRIVA
jgi:hypothetical protein